MSWPKAVKFFLIFAAVFFFGDRVLARIGEMAIDYSTMPDTQLYSGRGKADVLILGNSRAYHHFSEEDWSRELGLNVRVYAIEAASMEYMEALLKDYIDRYGRPKLVIIEPSCLTWGNDQIQNMKALAGRSERFAELLWKNFPEDYVIGNVVHLYRLNTTGYLNFLHKIVVPYRQPFLEGVISDEKIENLKKSDPKPYFDSKTENLKSLARISALSKLEGFNLQVVVTPRLRVFLDNPNELAKWIGDIKRAVGQNDSLLDLSGSIDEPILFFDGEHLNVQGVSRLFEIMKERGFFDRLKHVLLNSRY